MEARMTELEIKLSYAEDLLEELNRTVFRQQEQIERLQRQLLQLAQQLQDLTPPERGEARDEIPPHY
ncbi:SlyX protein [Sulfuritortus calidifontis]|uniref:SlyX protein n=1 Tax=Sulfuritortus calidifontis TaxID=1914471 RepID=A0A4R3JX45_9PROT|nr:SlyX family protein [Sulfuritortus calidifontis]TCS72960.1 SlyX protein [Sulfuritortus calidifontis]